MRSAMADNRSELQFFGRISASVSHEIKNVFAVINETAGLIKDFTLMSERGMPIPPDRLDAAANTIQGQIRRGDTLVKNMNAFSHSTDVNVRETDLVEVLELTVALTERFANIKQVSLCLGSCEPISMQASPFDLMRLLHSSLAAAIDGMNSGETLTVSVKPVHSGASFSLSSSGKDAPLSNDEDVSSVAEPFGVQVTRDESTRTASLLLPTTAWSE